jgi:enterochelin esterase-like enzyme
MELKSSPQGRLDRAPSALGRLLAARGTWLPPVAAVVVVAATGELLHLTRAVSDANQAFQVMGFDPDRAALLAAFMAEAIVVPIAVLLTGATLTSALAGVAVGASAFAQTFVDETRLASTPAAGQGSLDVTGWLLTVVTLGFAFLAIGWATAALAAIVRRRLGTALTTTREIVARRRSPASAGGPLAVVAVALLVVITVPVLGDMLNYDPDARMRAGATTTAGLAAAPQAHQEQQVPTLPAPVLDRPGILQIPGVAGRPPGAILAATQPWRAWQPSGSGSSVDVTFPAPWVDGTSTTAGVEIYLPPGYDTSNRRYPVLYEAPFSLASWIHGIDLPATLDELIDTGQMPASIVVFVSETGGPFPDSECANSADHREWFDRFITTQVVPYVDQHERTIPTAAARGIFGYSQGGFCASMLTLQHPDVFGTAIAFSGYALAGLRNADMPNAWRVYDGNPAIEAANSPLDLVRQISPSVAGKVMLMLSANPDESFFGSQYGMLASAAHDAGIPVDLFPTPFGHRWTAIRYQLPDILAALGERWTALGVLA